MPEQDEPDHYTLRLMRRIESKLDLLTDIVRGTCKRVGLLEQPIASLSSRLVGIENRLERIEKRLDLVDSSV